MNASSSPARTVLITGCSSGIGAALAHEFHARGCRVWATARRVEALRPLADLGMRVAALDVNDAQAVQRVAAQLQAEEGRLDLLVNNAGYGQFGAVVDVDAGAMRRQFDTNVIAPMLLVQALLPLLRAAAPWARVANVGSISGLVTTPFAGVYCASKAALHALSDALRMELAPLGVHVVTIQPGAIASHFGDAGAEHVQIAADSPYAPIAAAVSARARASQQGATPAADFAREVADHLLHPDPDPVCRAGAQSTRLPLLKKLLSTRRLDAVLRRRFGLDRLNATR